MSLKGSVGMLKISIYISLNLILKISKKKTLLKKGFWLLFMLEKNTLKVVFSFTIYLINLHKYGYGLMYLMLHHNILCFEYL